LASFHSGRWVFIQIPPPPRSWTASRGRRHEQLLGQRDPDEVAVGGHQPAIRPELLDPGGDLGGPLGVELIVARGSATIASWPAIR
jgi:hypothetical protein